MKLTSVRVQRSRVRPADPSRLPPAERARRALLPELLHFGLTLKISSGGMQARARHEKLGGNSLTTLCCKKPFVSRSLWFQLFDTV